VQREGSTTGIGQIQYWKRSKYTAAESILLIGKFVWRMPPAVASMGFLYMKVPTCSGLLISPKFPEINRQEFQIFEGHMTP
jgi:hypothetical protein